MWETLGGKANSSSMGANCGSHLVFYVGQSIVSFIKVLQGQIKCQLQTQKLALNSIVLLSECDFKRLGCTQIYSIYHAQMHVSNLDLAKVWDYSLSEMKYVYYTAIITWLYPKKAFSLLLISPLISPVVERPEANRARLFHRTKAECLFCCGLLSPLGKRRRCHIRSWTSLSSGYRHGLSIRMAQSAQFLQCKETSPPGANPHPSSPHVFSNSTPLDVWEAQLVVDHKALNHCLLIKHSTQRMRTGSPSPECQQWLQMRRGSPCCSISLQADIMALCLLERMATSVDTGFHLIFLKPAQVGVINK